jgi:hypothetical protein
MAEGEFMTLSVEIPPELESRLLEEAARKGVKAEDYAWLVLQERLQPEGTRQSVAGENGSAWSLLRSMAGTLEGPPDWSQELDHYLYGTPKRSESGE